jgi:hypothetical protein
MPESGASSPCSDNLPCKDFTSFAGQIAEILHVCLKTVETPRQQTMNKLEIHNIVELNKYAIREGLASRHSLTPTARHARKSPPASMFKPEGKIAR